MREVIDNMEIAELAVAVAFGAIGVFLGFVFSKIFEALKAAKFKREEKAISKTISRMSIWQIQEMSEQGKIQLEAGMKVLLEKIDKEITSIEVYHRDRSEIEDDIDALSGAIQQLAYS